MKQVTATIGSRPARGWRMKPEGDRISEQLARYGLTADDVLDLAGAVAASNFQRDGACIEEPGAARALFEPFLAGRREEVFAAAFLDTEYRLIRLEALFRGTIDGLVVYPRVVAERALRYGAAAVVVAHNHPAGPAVPSSADRATTDQLKAALALLDIHLLDHLVIAAGACCSVLEIEQSGHEAVLTALQGIKWDPLPGSSGLAGA